MASYLINELPDIDRMSYLEIGAYQQTTFRAVNAAHKVCVDPEFPATFTGTSDEFFAQNEEKFDVVYIDGDHSAEQVEKDFNNAVRCLNPRGHIFIHDMYPPDEEHTASHYCGDGFKFLWALHTVNYPNVFVQNSDYGLTLVRYPDAVLVSAPDITYQQFVDGTVGLRRFTRYEMMAFCRGEDV